eukprot:TRINITY_DN66887_c0_g1_i1.p1 TRINITY_DN66887_c0_g1~~TRINITY_DN66887_c0_g1_i1.p1  ORF type:complete len:420 (+),score=87.22 TRINITY_DN66887_c0_g1_i1:126-1262(+)
MGEPVVSLVAAAERMAERWARRKLGSGNHQRLRRGMWRLLLRQAHWPIAGLLALLWDLRRSYTDLGGDLEAEPGWRELKLTGNRLVRAGRQKAQESPQLVGVAAEFNRPAAWPDALDPLPADTPGWMVPLFRFENDPEVFGAHAAKGRCSHLRGALLEARENAVVLDVGAGTAPCRHLWESRKDIRYMTQDSKMYDHAAGRGLGPGMFRESSIGDRGGYARMDIESDIADIPLANASVDVIICEQVLEHVLHPVSAVREMGRLLRPGGLLIITVPYGPYLHNLPYHYNGGLTKGWFDHYLSEAGFGHVQTAYRYTLPGRALSRLGIAETCVQAHVGPQLTRVWQRMVLHMLPTLTDALHGICSEVPRRPQGLALAAVK